MVALKANVRLHGGGGVYVTVPKLLEFLPRPLRRKILLGVTTHDNLPCLVAVLSSSFTSATAEMNRIPQHVGRTPVRWFQHVKAGKVPKKPGTYQFYIPKAIVDQLLFSWGGVVVQLLHLDLKADEKATILLLHLPKEGD